MMFFVSSRAGHFPVDSNIEYSWTVEGRPVIEIEEKFFGSFLKGKKF